MVERIYPFTVGDSKIIEKTIEDDNVAINHMVLRNGEALPEHYSNSNAYMVVVRGAVTLRLAEQEEHRYQAGNIVAIPYQTKMNVGNDRDEILEFFVVKSPSPRKMGR